MINFALDQMADALYLFDASGRLLYANQTTCQTLGYGHDELLTMRVGDIAPDLQPMFVGQAGPRHGQRLTGHHRTRNGRLFPVEIKLHGFEFQGHPCHLAFVQDIGERQQNEKELCRLVQDFSALAEHSPDLIVRYDRECRRIYVNPTVSATAGVPRAALLGKRPSEGTATEEQLHYEAQLRSVLSSGKGCQFEYPWPTHGGRSLICQFTLTPEFTPDGEVGSVLAIGRDISAFKESERRLQRAEALAHIGHWQWDYRSQTATLSAEVCRIFGQDSDWLPSLADIMEKIVADDRERVRLQFANALDRRQPEVAYSYRVDSPEHGPLHLHSHVHIEYGPNGERLRLIGTTQDISELKHYESRLHQMAFHDSLTGLPNRALLSDRLRQSLSEATRRGQVLGLLVLDLDRFKEINDSHGHRVGDRLLYEVAQRLTGLVRDYDSVARLGGDEFAIVLPEIREAADLGSVSRKILEALARPFRIADQDLYISTSIGIAVFPADGNTTDALLQYADSALYDAKARGRAGFRFYSSELTAKSKDRAALEAALRRAEPDGQLELFYQPKIDLNSGRLVGAEALLRWHHPTLGLVPPDKFIGIAEDNGLIVGIGTWVLTMACLTAQRWNQGGRDLKIAVNLSARQFRDDDLVATVCSVLALTDCEPRWLELEITESLLLDDDEGVRAALQSFRRMGISIAIDDFGTGYSALGYLKRFPIDVLKIDRSFTSEVTIERDSTELVKAIITMARSLRLQLVAEGIETETQERFLQAHGCHLGQGYRYSRPIPRDEFESLLLAPKTIQASA